VTPGPLAAADLLSGLLMPRRVLRLSEVLLAAGLTQMSGYCVTLLTTAWRFFFWFRFALQLAAEDMF
jgi:hypothetical protein